MNINFEFHEPKDKLPEHRWEILLYIDGTFAIGAYMDDKWWIERDGYHDKVPENATVEFWAELDDMMLVEALNPEEIGEIIYSP